MNYVQIAGRLGRDPEIRHTQDGKRVTSLSMATSRKRKGQDSTVWYKVTVWGEQFEKLIGYLKKGSAVVVVGELEAKIYTDKGGSPQVSLEITPWNIGFSPFGKEQEVSQTSPSVMQSETLQGQNKSERETRNPEWETQDLPF